MGKGRKAEGAHKGKAEGAHKGAHKSARKSAKESAEESVNKSATGSADELETEPEEEPAALPVLAAQASGRSARSALVVAGVIILAVGAIVAVHFSNSAPVVKQRRAARAQGLEQAFLSHEAE